MPRDRTAASLFGIILYPGVEPIDLGATLGVLSMASRILPNLRATTLATQSGPIELAGGLRVHVEHALHAAPDLDVAIVTGGPGWPDAARDPALLAFLRARTALTASVCTGALILQAAGRLDGRMATTRRHALGAEPASPLARLGPAGIEACVVDTGDIVTGGGVSLAADTTLHLLARLYGPDAAEDVARAIEYDRAWAANRAALGVIQPNLSVCPERRCGESEVRLRTARRWSVSTGAERPYGP